MMLLIEININICFAKENVFYTDSGIVLTQEQYNILSEVFSDEMIKSMPKDNLKSFINMDKINIYDEKEIYIRVDENLDSTRKKVINSNERIISKKEANYILNNSNVQTMSTSDSHNTAMKKMTMRLSDGSMSGYKTIQVICEWIKLPTIRSYDVIGIRPTKKCTLYSNSSSPNFWGKQTTDVGTFNYGYGMYVSK